MTEREANKAALCSAVFAGFAYVGYTLFRQQFERQPSSRNRKDRGFMLRRLSQSTQPDQSSSGTLIYGGADGDKPDAAGRGGSRRLVFTSVSVQQRIKQLNRQARQFAETMMAVQTPAGVGTRRPHGAHHRSSQCTPWQTPRTLSPLSFRMLSTSHSSDQLALSPCASSSSSAITSGFLTAPRQRLRQRRELLLMEASAADDQPVLLSEQEQQCLSALLSSDSNRILERSEAAVLVKMLRVVTDVDTVRKTLITISNCCAFTQNQGSLREAGLVPLLTAHLLHPCPAVQMAASQAASNMALNDGNQTMMQDCVEVLLSLLESEDSAVREAVLSCLVNVSALDRWHSLFTPYLSFLFSFLDVAPPGVQLQSLRLLVNLSCNDTMVPCLLAAKAPDRLLRHLSVDTDTSRLLRVLTLYANLVAAAARLHIDPSTDLPTHEKAASPDTVYARLLGSAAVTQLSSRCRRLAAAGLPDDQQLLDQLHRLSRALPTSPASAHAVSLPVEDNI